MAWYPSEGSARGDGVHLTYDKMASLLASYGSKQALAVANDLAAKIMALLERVAVSAGSSD